MQLEQDKMKIDWPKRGHAYTEKDLFGLTNLLTNDRGLTAGTEVQAFETEFAEKFKLGQCFATMSCAHALDITGKLIIDDDDAEVILPAHTYCASAIGFARAGAKLIWADIDESHLTITLNEVKRLTTSRTKAIIVVHLYGLICPEIKQIVNYAKSQNIKVIEDCAQCIGARLDGQYAGSFGDFATFSFHAQKNLTTLGEGGMLVAYDKNLKEKIIALRLNGHLPFPNQDKYWLPAMTDVTNQSKNSWPMKATITEAQALVGRNVLLRLNEMLKKRKNVASMISEAFADTELVTFQSNVADMSHCNHLMPFKLRSPHISRNKFIERMHINFGIKCAIQYYPLYRYDLFKSKGFGHKGLQITDNFYDNMISLPFCHETSEEQANYLINAMQKILLVK